MFYSIRIAIYNGRLCARSMERFRAMDNATKSKGEIDVGTTIPFVLVYGILSILSKWL